MQPGPSLRRTTYQSIFGPRRKDRSKVQSFFHSMWKRRKRTADLSWSSSPKHGKNTSHQKSWTNSSKWRFGLYNADWATRGTNASQIDGIGNPAASEAGGEVTVERRDWVQRIYEQSSITFLQQLVRNPCNFMPFSLEQIILIFQKSQHPKRAL